MHTEIRHGKQIVMGPTTGHVDHATSAPVLFSGTVTDATVVLTGCDCGFSNSDHHVWRERLVLTPHIDNDVVYVTVEYGFRDHSGTFDDAYSAELSWDVIALVEDDQPTPQPRKLTSKAEFYGLVNLGRKQDHAPALPPAGAGAD